MKELTPKIEATPLVAQPETVVPAVGSADGAKTVAQKVLEFARSKIDSQVGDGECSDLAIEALKSAGGKIPFRTSTAQELIWGTLVKDPKSGQPGDLIQFRNAKFEVVHQRKTASAIYTQRVATISPDHTAVISGNLGNGKLSLLDQNVNGRKTVKERELDLTTQIGGSIKVYRPQPKK